MLTFPSPPLKFRTTGFPQYGFKLDSSATTFDHPFGRAAYTWPSALHRTPVALAGMCAGAISQDVPVQRPFALRPVLLSGQIQRYYGLICASPRFPPIYVLDDGPFHRSCRVPERIPNLICLSVLIVPPSVPRRTEATASDCCFIASTGLRQGHTGSAPAPDRWFFIRVPNEAAKFALCCGPTSCWPFTIQGVYVRAFTSRVTSNRRRI